MNEASSLKIINKIWIKKGFNIDKDMKKKDLLVTTGISWASVTKLSKGETVSMGVLMKICKALNCNVGDIMDLIPEEEENSEQQ